VAVQSLNASPSKKMSGKVVCTASSSSGATYLFFNLL
jgi:hypothetical protein